jgi:hypothetical protein
MAAIPQNPESDMNAGTDEPIVLPTKEARQATRGLPVRNVLIGGLTLVIIAFVILYFVLPR